MFTFFQSKNLKKIFVLLLFILFLAGIYGSLKIVFTTFKVESDFSDTAMLWLGFKAYGWPFFSKWIYTVDNWLLSLVPIHFLLFYFFGPDPVVVLLSGFGIFIVSIILTAMLAKNLNAPKTAILLPLMLAFSGRYAHEYGYLTYPISHNISNLYGLFALLMTIVWIQKRKIYSLIGLFSALIIAGVSDPWLLGAYLYPLLVTSLICWFIAKKNHSINFYKSLIITIFLSLVVIKTRFLFLLKFLPYFHFKTTTVQHIFPNVITLIKDTSQLLNILPLSLSNQLIACLVSFAIIMYLLLNTLIINYIRKMYLKPEMQFTLVVMMFSIMAMVVSFTLSPYTNQDDSSRFLVNLIFLIPLMIAVTLEHHWHKATKLFKFLSLLFALLFLLSGINSTLAALRVQGFKINDDYPRRLIDFLDKNDLHIGYGAYWGSAANAVTWLSNGSINITPVRFSPSTGFISFKRAQTSRFWEFKNNENKPFFVFISNDNEECLKIDVCLKGIITQFGPPEKILSFENSFIYVWSKQKPQPLMLRNKK